VRHVERGVYIYGFNEDIPAISLIDSTKSTLRLDRVSFTSFVLVLLNVTIEVIQ
jgi:hypothetical protein